MASAAVLSSSVTPFGPAPEPMSTCSVAPTGGVNELLPASTATITTWSAPFTVLVTPGALIDALAGLVVVPALAFTGAAVSTPRTARAAIAARLLVKVQV